MRKFLMRFVISVCDWHQFEWPLACSLVAFFEFGCHVEFDYRCFYKVDMEKLLMIQYYLSVHIV